MAKPIYILGLSCYYHDSAACLVRDGEVIFAAQEERYTRKKHDDRLPLSAVQQALAFAGIEMSDIDAVGFYEKPLLKFFDRILPMSIRAWPRGYLQFRFAMNEWMTKKLWIPQDIQKKLKYKGKIYFSQHHESHAASAYYCSGFDDAAILTVDGVGEWATATIGKGQGNDMKLIKEIHFPHSLGLLYSAITYYLGFKVNSAEYKVMGLAPYGQPTYVELMRKLIRWKEDGSFQLDMKYFTYDHGMTMTGKAMEKLFGQPRRAPEGELTQFHKDVARSLQEITDQLMLKLAETAKKETGSKNLCMAGGVALNCVSNGKILRSGLFDNIFIQPAAGDAGGALGVALLIWHRKFGGKKTEKMEHAFLGNAYTNADIEAIVQKLNLPYERMDDATLIPAVADLLQGNNVIGWYQGRMEFGPRSLGNRSIIADARNAENWQKVNLKIKFRESFRPFAPTVLEEKASEYFDLHTESPYMLIVADTFPDKRSVIPAVTHVDGSARIQTIRHDQNPRYYDLIKEFDRKTGCPVIINTSFNVRGEPIVESPEDALNCFLHTNMDYLVMENILLSKKDMIEKGKEGQEEYLKKFELD